MKTVFVGKGYSQTNSSYDLDDFSNGEDEVNNPVTKIRQSWKGSVSFSTLMNEYPNTIKPSFLNDSDDEQSVNKVAINQNWKCRVCVLSSSSSNEQKPQSFREKISKMFSKKEGDFQKLPEKIESISSDGKLSESASDRTIFNSSEVDCTSKAEDVVYTDSRENRMEDNLTLGENIGLGELTHLL